MLKHSSVGRTTHSSGTAGAYIRYITRESACSYVFSHLIPKDRWKARYWLDIQEQKSRKNGRVCDKLIMALPLELSTLQRQALVKSFMLELTQNKVPYYVAFHDKEKDAGNPHCHVAIRDNCPTTGKKVLKLSSSYSTYHLHDLWRVHLAKWGFDVRPSSEATKQKYKRPKPKQYYYRQDKSSLPKAQVKNSFDFTAF